MCEALAPWARTAGWAEVGGSRRGCRWRWAGAQGVGVRHVTRRPVSADGSSVRCVGDRPRSAGLAYIGACAAVRGGRVFGDMTWWCPVRRCSVLGQASTLAGRSVRTATSSASREESRCQAPWPLLRFANTSEWKSVAALNSISGHFNFFPAILYCTPFIRNAFLWSKGNSL